MTLDARAHRAAAEFRRAIDDLERSTPQRSSFDRFDRLRRRRQRTRRIGVTVVALGIALVSVYFAARAIPRGEVPANPSPTNGLIVYRRSAIGQDEGSLFTIGADGRGGAALPVSFTDCAEWSPDGTRLHITASRYPGSRLRPAVIEADGSGFTLLDGTRDRNLNLGCGDWSPDATRLVVEGFPQSGHPELNGIYTVRASDGGGLTLVSRNPFGGYDSVPRYSPDGSLIVFLRTDPARNLEPDVGALFVVHPDGTGLTRVTPWGEAASSGDFSADGRWIVFADRGGQIDAMHPDGTDVHTIPVDLGSGRPLEPRFSPDGTMVVFGLETGGQGDIYTVRVDGSGLTAIVNTPHIDERWPDWGTSSG